MESKINEWIVNRLSINLPEFNNLPACPFAKEALVNNKILSWNDAIKRLHISSDAKENQSINTNAK